MKKLIHLFLLIAILAGCQSEKKAIPFNEYLAGLNTTKLNSIDKAYEKFLDVPPAKKDSAFIKFRNFYYEVRTKNDSAIFSTPAIQKRLYKDDDLLDSLDQVLADYGFKVASSEGFYFLEEKPDYLYKKFRGYVSKSIEEFLEQRSKEIREGFADDAALMISFNKIGERTFFWENYLNKYPESLLKEDAQFYCKLYFASFLCGMDNTPIFGYDGFLKNEVRKAYQNYLDEHPKTESGKILAKYYRIIKDHNFQNSSEAEKFLKEKDLYYY